MREIIAIALREVVVRVYRRSFFIGGFVMPAILTLSFIIPSLLISRVAVERDILVFDQSDDPALFPAINEKVRSSNFGTKFTLSQVTVSGQEDVNEMRRNRSLQVKKDFGQAIMVLPRGVLDDEQPEYYASNVSDPSLMGLSQMVGTAIMGRRLGRLGINPNEIEQYSKNTDLKVVKITAEGNIQPGSGGGLRSR